jgi:hypothetical protein
MQRTRFSWLSWLALAVSVVAVGLLMAAGPGYQAGWFALGTALQRMLTWAAYLGTGALALGVASLLANAWKGGAAAVSRSVIAIVLGALSVGVPLRWQREVQSVPRIHDISTDTVTPPRYVELARIRQDLQVPNSLDYLEEVAEQQRTGYPDLGPVFLAMPPAEAHARALAAAERLGWEIVASDVSQRPNRSHRHDVLVPLQGRCGDTGVGGTGRHQPGGRALGVARRPQRHRHQRPPHPQLPGRTGRLTNPGAWPAGPPPGLKPQASSSTAARRTCART